MVEHTKKKKKAVWPAWLNSPKPKPKKKGRKRKKKPKSCLPVQIVYTDGSGRNKTKKDAAWGFFYSKNKKKHRKGGYLPAPSTSNVGELTAVVECVKHFRKSESRTHLIKIKSDSTYVITGFKRIESMVAKGIVNGRKTKPDDKINKKVWWMLWQALKDSPHKYEISWVKAHSGVFGNEMADQLVKKVMTSCKDFELTIV